jgi:pimeloyl-ACP methyl ester carboxylesterase
MAGAGVTPLVFVHGGGFAGSCWDLVLSEIDGPALAVDLPGRGSHEAPPGTLTIAGAANSVVADVDAAGFDELVLVGHSLAGCSMPATIGLFGARVRHAVFVGCTVPEDGKCGLDTLPPDVQAMVRGARDPEADTLDPEIAKAFFGNDLDDRMWAWCLERMVPEGVKILFEPVDLTPLRTPMPRTWVRPVRDAIVDPDKQLIFAGNVGNCEVIDIDAGHMCMISKPGEVAGIVSRIARNP